MERSKAAHLKVTPESYVQAIISLSKRFSSTSSFPGNNYVDIVEWMLQDRGLLNSSTAEENSSLFVSKSDDSHDLVVVYNTGERKWDVQQYNNSQHMAFYTANPALAEGSGQIVFIRGFISPVLLSVIGSKYKVDPEFFRRHMDFLSASVDRHAYGFPSLASSSDSIFRLCRSDRSIELRAYKTQQLRSTKIACGDSVVREYSTVCSSFSVVEQWISLCITKKQRGWAVIVWLDQGRPLDKSPSGPWTSHLESKATPLPVLQHHHRMAFRTTFNRLDPHANVDTEVPQSTSVLPLQYDSLLALVDLVRHAPHDPLSMCIPLFAHAAFSEVQFLNLMESRIQIQVNAIIEGFPADALGTLQYFSTILNRHAQQIKDSTRALCRLAEWTGQVSNEPSAESPMSKNTVPPGQGIGTQKRTAEQEPVGSIGISNSEGAFTAKGLLEDYEQLHARCAELSQMCIRSINLAMNKATIEESRKAIEQSERLKKLTMLATLFIPLTFSSSVFGMNIDLLGQNAVNFWWYFVFCGPIILLTYVIYLWDYQAIKRALILLWSSRRSARRDEAIGRADKDPNHAV